LVIYNDARADRLDAAFGALADSSRRAILSRLSKGELSVSALAEPLDMSMPAVLKHLRVLESAGLITAVKEGRVRRCRFDRAAFDAVDDWLADTRAFWHLQLDRLADHLASQEKTTWPPPPPPRSASPSAARSRRRAKKSSARGRTRKS
jgi:DNA-binding transcriptional ArsR family regulator